ncbi:FAD:protein FMN transferase [Pseudolysobacter antarcticus]|uniref:FAD:protein FMN transferase n=1 Tax=Pseudolysobacter antarcticus TaxID=2511995 RepID=A0A411HQ08_9GAMM|nr:FAD:protein FMN transferase [Pseudolysobacter antarcticus]
MLRARPWLGTLVEIRVDGLAEADAVAATDAAFAEIATIHRCMSFHEPDSDLARLHRARAGSAVQVDPHTWNVLQTALVFAEESRGCFDPTIAAQLVAWNFLPRPRDSGEPDPAASWSNIELLPESQVRLHRALWIDLGGIAKGYAVDCAIRILRNAGATAGGVNAGGDLAVFGAAAQTVHVRDPRAPQNTLPLLELRDAAVATSAGYFERRRAATGWLGPHVHGKRRGAVGTHSSVSVIAPSCMHADALTKIVLADARIAAKLLPRYGAQVCRYDSQRGWRTLRGE